MPPRSCSRRESTNFHLSYTFLHLWMKKHHTIAESMAQQKENNILDGFTQCTQMTIVFHLLPRAQTTGHHQPAGMSRRCSSWPTFRCSTPAPNRPVMTHQSCWSFQIWIGVLWVQTSFRCWSNHTFKTQPGLVSLMVVYIYTHNIRW